MTMPNHRLVIIAALKVTVLLHLLSSAQAQQAVGPVPVSHSQVIYTCLMHPDVVSDKPGDCPKCGMPLVRAERKKPTSTASSHQNHMSRSETPASERIGDHSEHSMVMASSINLADPMSRESSGTSWMPESTLM